MSIFDTVKIPKVKTSVFNLSEEAKLSCNFGQLIPILCKETLPNDKFKISTELLIKLAPLKAPVMHRLKAKVDYFFVPNYQISNKFADFINPKVNTQANPILMPKIPIKFLRSYGNNGTTETGFNMVATLADYLGLPVTQSCFSGNASSDRLPLSILPFLAYQHIYNEYYRDQNLQIASDPSTDTICDIESFKDLSGTITSTFNVNQLRQLLKLRNSAWKKDYFTSALPSPQAGDDVFVPVGDSAPVTGVPNFVSDSGGTFIQGTDKSPFILNHSGNVSSLNAMTGEMSSGKLKVSSGLSADLSQATGISINNLRKLFSLQRFKELAERGGTRYTEMVRNFFGAYLPDGFFDRPLYLGGTITPISVGEVVQTAPASGSESSDTPIAYRAGNASAYGRTRSVEFRCPAHGYIMGILRILPEATYQQGVERMWTRESIYDFAFPQFANLGEQEIRNQEIYATGIPNTDNGVFGYTPRYAEYKEGHCHVAGEFRNTLGYWHFGRQFSNAPQLNRAFVMMEQMNYSPFNVTDGDTEHVYVNLYNSIVARRPLPYFGTPSVL